MAPDSRPYSAPALEHLGTISSVTAGPNSGTLDQMFGGSGGFQPDTTS